MKEEIICKKCGISKQFFKFLPKMCIRTKQNLYPKHQWAKANMCSCGHNETSHYKNKAGMIQCSIDECFPYNLNGHNVIFSKEQPNQS